jgi:hypothetical protein
MTATAKLLPLAMSQCNGYVPKVSCNPPFSWLYLRYSHCANPTPDRALGGHTLTHRSFQSPPKKVREETWGLEPVPRVKLKLDAPWLGRQVGSRSLMNAKVTVEALTLSRAFVDEEYRGFFPHARFLCSSQDRVQTPAEVIPPGCMYRPSSIFPNEYVCQPLRLLLTDTILFRTGASRAMRSSS